MINVGGESIGGGGRSLPSKRSSNPRHSRRRECGRFSRVRAAGRAGAVDDLAKKVRSARIGGTPPEAEQPFLGQSAVKGDVAPECFGMIEIALQDLAEAAVRHLVEGHGSECDRAAARRASSIAAREE